jgi:hypothetical protein
MRSTTRLLGLFLCSAAAACAGSSESARYSDLDDSRGSGSAGYVYDLDAEEPPAEPAATLALERGAGGWDDDVTRRRSDASAQAVEKAPAGADRMLIYSGQVRVEVAQPDDVMAAFREQVAAWGGHLQSQVDRTLVVRVPAEHFEEAFEWVSKQGRVLSEARRVQDITEEMIDLDIRLLNARKARERLLEILQKADKVEDILKVEAELRRVTEEIERMEGRRKLLSDQVALSTLEVTFQPIADAPIAKRRRLPSRFGWINRIGAERVMEDF